jgi:hypothetical protein
MPLTLRPQTPVGYPEQVPRRLTTWIALVVLCALPAPVVAAIPDGRTNDPLERGVLLSVGSIYRIETTVTVTALRTRAGTTYPLGPVHTVTELGTAFAVAPSGVLATDAHVAAPFGAALAVAAAPMALAQRGEFGDTPAYVKWVDDNHVVPVGVHLVAMRIWRASAGSATPARTVPAHVIPGSVENGADVALIQLAHGNVPALTLNDGETLGTPVAAIGYGVGTPTTLGLPTTLVPGVKTGTIGQTGSSKAAPGQDLTLVNAPISRGDSGAPVVDAEAAWHGIVRFTTSSGGAMDQAQAVLDDMQRLNIANANGPVFVTFQRGMDALWAGNYGAAEAAFGATLAADPGHPLAAREQRLATRLASAKPVNRHPRWWRGLFLTLAVATALGALFCLRRLLVVRRTRREGRGGPPGVSPAG